MPVSTEARRGSPALRFALAWLVSLAVAVVAVLRAGPPLVAPADAAATDAVSGERALEVLARLVGDGSPRPVGSEANAAARARIVTELERLGLEVEVQETFAVRDGDGAAGRTVCGTVRNIVARRRGAGGHGLPGEEGEPLRALLCMAHYDSVGAGPGVSDDLAGVAAWLEVARALRAGGRALARDLVFLFSDAEEHGLLGAEAFAAQHPWAADVGAVINLEGRGTSGPSRMFETGADNDWIAAAFARGATRPSTTSLSAELYRRMPNDTDYTVFRRRGLPGLNFAWIGGVSRYHTPLDDLAHIDPRSLQHHATNAYDAVLALDGAAWRGPGRGRGDAVYTDVLGLDVWLVREHTARALALGALLLVLYGVARVTRGGGAMGRPVASIAQVSKGALAALSIVIAAAALAHGAARLDELVAGVARPWRAHPLPAVLGLLGAAVTAAALMVQLTTRAIGAAGLALGGGIVACLITLLLALFAPGASVLLLAPVLVVGLGAALARWGGDGAASAGRISVVAAPISLFVLAPLGAALVDAFGLAPPSVKGPSLGLVLGVVLGLWALFAAPVIAGATAGSRLALGALGAVAVAFGAVMSTVMPAISAVAPGHLDVVYASEYGRGLAEWHIATSGDPVPDALLTSATFGVAQVKPSWPLKHVAAAPAPAGLLRFPDLVDVTLTPSADGLVIGATLRSRAGAQEFDLRTAGVAQVLVEGRPLKGARGRVLGPSAEGVRLQLVLAEGTEAAPTLTVTERMLHALPAARFLSDARGPKLVPTRHGDGAQLTREFVLTADALRPTGGAH
ncbi:MAG: M20/M25/M40 family metallo-hydrolase [Planctomycetota bacterium]